MYQHRLIKQTSSTSSELFQAAVGKVVCVGRNYADHAAELNNAVPREPVLFIKPASATACFSEGIGLSPALLNELRAIEAGAEQPKGLTDLHYEAELALLIGENLAVGSTAKACLQAIAGIGLGLDLTLRSLQQQLKQQALPWEKAKAFDGSCLLTDFIIPQNLPALDALRFQLKVDNELRQTGDTALMLFPIVDLLPYICRWFSLQAGDVILTGTPKGVGCLKAGQTLSLCLPSISGSGLLAHTFVREQSTI